MADRLMGRRGAVWVRFVLVGFDLFVGLDWARFVFFCTCSICGFGSVWYVSVRFQYVLLRFGLIWFGLVCFFSVRFCFGLFRFRSVPFCSVPFRSVRFYSARFGSRALWLPHPQLFSTWYQRRFSFPVSVSGFLVWFSCGVTSIAYAV